MSNKFYKLVTGCLAGLAMAGSVQSQTIYTFCGSTGGYAGDGGPASAARLALPGAIKYHNGYIYVVDGNNELIRRIDASSPFTINSIAGSQSIGFSGDGGPATAAETYLGGQGGGVVADNSGNVYFTDTYNGRIRKIDVSGTISTVAGGGSGGDGVAATASSLSRPMGLAIDGTGSLYVCDEQAHKIRKIDAATGIITTIAGTGAAGYTGDGGAATAAELDYPEGIALDASGNIYYSDYDNNVVRKITVATGVINTFATGLNRPAYMEFDQAGNLFVGNFQSDGQVVRILPSGVWDVVAGTGTTSLPSGDGGPATAAGLGSPRSVTITPGGSLLISTRNNDRIRIVQPVTATITGTASMCTGTTTTLAASVPGAAWISGNTAIATVSAGGVVTGVSSGTATITYVAGLVFGTRVVTVNAAVVPVVTASGATLSVAGTYVTYQWSVGGTPIAGATNATYDATSNGTYAVAVTNAEGCPATSANFVLSSVSVNTIGSSNSLLLAPNPAIDGCFAITVPFVHDEPVTVTVTNVAGIKVYETIATAGKAKEIRIDVPAGMYFVQAITAGARYSTKIMVN